MSTRICENYDEAMKVIKEYKEKFPDFRGHINIEFEDKTFQQGYDDGLAKFSENKLSSLMTRYNWLSDCRYPASSYDREHNRINEARGLFEEIIEEKLYKDSNVNTEMYTSSIYGNRENQCYIPIFEGSAKNKIYMSKTLVHEYKHRLVCLEIDSDRFYFAGDKTITKIDKILDAEQVILRILQRIYDIDYTRKMYGY